MEELKKEMLTQDSRCTADPIFIVVEDKKVYGVENNELRERKNTDLIDADKDLCIPCIELWNAGMLPSECDNFACDSSFINYRIEEDVPNLRAAFFFTGKACDEHIAANRHHYNHTAHSYAISAYHNYQLKNVIEHLKNLYS